MVKLSLMETLGLELMDVSLVDLVPGSPATATAVEAIMKIIPEGTKRAEVANLLLTGQVDAIKNLTPEQAANIQGILFAQKLTDARNIDLVMNTGGGQFTIDQTLMNKVARNTKPK